MYSTSFLQTTRCHKVLNFAVLIQAMILLSVCVGTTQAQRPSGQQARDIVRGINNKELDRLLFLKPILAPKDDPAKRAILKQISEDFKDLQGLNNKMMAVAWSRQELDYRFVSDMVSQIRGKATRLKSNLALPETENTKTPPAVDVYPDEQKFRVAMLQLDRHIMSFATNPLFQKPEVMEVGLANQASRDLAVVVELAAKLKKNAARLGKSAKISP